MDYSGDLDVPVAAASDVDGFWAAVRQTSTPTSSSLEPSIGAGGSFVSDAQDDPGRQSDPFSAMMGQHIIPSGGNNGKGFQGRSPEALSGEFGGHPEDAASAAAAAAVAAAMAIVSSPPASAPPAGGGPGGIDAILGQSGTEVAISDKEKTRAKVPKQRDVLNPRLDILEAVAREPGIIVGAKAAQAPTTAAGAGADVAQEEGAEEAGVVPYAIATASFDHTAFMRDMKLVRMSLFLFTLMGQLNCWIGTRSFNCFERVFCRPLRQTLRFVAYVNSSRAEGTALSPSWAADVRSIRASEVPCPRKVDRVLGRQIW